MFERIVFIGHSNMNSLSLDRVSRSESKMATFNLWWDGDVPILLLNRQDSATGKKLVTSCYEYQLI